ncbi:hypothetical protein SDRG_01316 [Saprolegnia diclina VS20]|uniref:Adenylate kinase n=1 Tax=Saprolegnia diclina (strain VS20) TaxID=1156394 RepID=T0SEJ6_SAPDV|nr:hypothetical protein SDRG_01316 [Saprolegnia diclina VS20]EQC41342.1 hypothetical protein SDRG_01316 [Saprolegnia diclina VS20]|eukprot:XP_008605056.1 hypothetical protein SDRG_01316 [Saprolegnia diclina VS20]
MTSERMGDRIVVLGMTCAGKSTLGAALAAARGVPFVESDALFWAPAWTPVPTPEYVQRMDAATSGDAWVVAGCCSAAHDLVLGRATTVIYLDYPFYLHFIRLVKRTLTRWWTQELLWGTNREGLWEHLKLWSSESLFHHLIRKYHQRRTVYWPNAFAAHAHLQVLRLPSLAATESYLDACASTTSPH